jgi:hypothetical protein
LWFHTAHIQQPKHSLIGVTANERRERCSIGNRTKEPLELAPRQLFSELGLEEVPDTRDAIYKRRMSQRYRPIATGRIVNLQNMDDGLGQKAIGGFDTGHIRSNDHVLRVRAEPLEKVPSGIRLQSEAVYRDAVFVPCGRGLIVQARERYGPGRKASKRLSHISARRPYTAKALERNNKRDTHR